MQRIHLKDNIYIGSKNGFILTFQQLELGEESKSQGEKYFDTAKTYLRAEQAVDGIKRNYGVATDAQFVTDAFKRSVKETAIEVSKRPKRSIGSKSKGEE